MGELYGGILAIEDQISAALNDINEILTAAQKTIEMCGSFAKVGIAAIVVILVLVISVLVRQNQIERKIDDLSNEIKDLNKYISGGE